MAAQTPLFLGRRRQYASDGTTIEDTYLVQTTALADGEEAAIAAVTALAAPAGYRQESVSGQHQNRNPLWYTVTIAYKSNQGGTTSEDPLDRPSILTSSYEEWTEAYFIDAEGLLVINSAGEQYESFPQRKNGALVLQVTKNMPTFPAVSYDSFKFTTNAEAVVIRGTTYLANALLFLPATVQEIYENVGTTTYHYYATTFRLAADENLHVHNIEDRGYNQIIAGETMPVPILDGAGAPVTKPWPLNGSGGAKAAGLAPEVTTFHPYASASWGINFD